MEVKHTFARRREPRQLDLQSAFDHVYESGSYDLDIDYRKDPAVPLSGATEAWARGIIASRGDQNR